MARQHTAAERALVAGEHVNDHFWVEILDTDLVWRDLGTLFGNDWLASADLDDATENNVVSGEIVIRRDSYEGAFDISLSPLMEGSPANRNAANAFAPLINSDRPIRIFHAVTEEGVAPTLAQKREIFTGYTGDIAQAGRDDSFIHIPVTDKGKRLVVTQIENEHNYGLPEGESLEIVVQKIIDDPPANAITLNSPVPSLWELRPYTQAKAVSKMEAITALSTQIGYISKYKYDASDVSKFTLYAPDRTKEISDDIIGPEEYFDVEELRLVEAEIKNKIEITFIDRDTNTMMTAYSVDTNNSIPQYGERFMRINNAPNIDTMVEAQRLCDAAYPDLSLPRATERIRINHYWMGEVGDMHTLKANGKNYDVDQQRAVVSWHMHFENATLETTFTYRGKPAGRYYDWYHLASINLVRGNDAPELTVKLLDTSTKDFAYYQVDSTIPLGSPVTIYYAFGEDAYVLNVVNGGVITVPRATNDSGDRLLRILAVSTNNLRDERIITVDYDTTPEIGVVSEAIPIYTGGIQTGWRLKGTVDDDTRALVLSLTAGLTYGASSIAPYFGADGTIWFDTTNTKTWSIDLTQVAGQRGTVTLTPREHYDYAAPGAGGQPFVLTLERSAVTVANVREISATQREVTITAQPNTAVINYRVNEGAWQTCVGKVTFQVDVEGTERRVEFYSTTAFGTVEETKRLVIDQDSQPGITAHVLTESTPNNAHLVMGFDDDVTHWRMWARRNLYPTPLGTLASTDTQDPLSEYIRYDGGMEKTTLDWRVGGSGDGTSNWRVIVRAYDDVGNFVQWVGSILISGAPPVTGSLSNLHAQHSVEGGLNYNDVLWDHNQTVQDVAHTVLVRESDNGAAYVQLVIGRDAKIDHDGGAVGLIGGYHVQKPWVAAGTPGAVFHTYAYQVELHRASDNGLVATYTASMSGWEAGGGGGGDAPPATIPNTLAVFGEQLQARGTWVSPDHVSSIRIVWQRWNGAAYVDYASYNLAPDTLTHTQTGLTAGDQFRFKVIYYNAYGDSTAGYATSAAAIVQAAGSPPTETPSALDDITLLGPRRLRALWTNTASYSIRIRFARDPNLGAGPWLEIGVYDLAPGTTLKDHSAGYVTGDYARFGICYFNDVGEGPIVFSASDIIP